MLEDTEHSETLDYIPMVFDEHGQLVSPPNREMLDLANLASLDETLDADLKHLLTPGCGLQPIPEFIPHSPRGRPDSHCLTGNYNFRVEVNSNDVHKKKFLYSHKLNRIYVEMNCNFSVAFNWDHTMLPNMFVRATCVFSDHEQSEKRVTRCTQHFHESSGLDEKIATNVLHSSREINSQDVYYCGDMSVPDSWLSVLVHFNKTSPEPCTHAYKFTCKSSCASGINRRAIAIIFTLENSCGTVYGRQTVGVKVCSCIRRDMQKDEEAEGVYKSGKKRIPANQLVPRTKKIKVEARDVPNMVILPQVLVDRNAAISGLRSMVDMMVNAGVHNPEVVDRYAPSIANLNKEIKKLEAEQ